MYWKRNSQPITINNDVDFEVSYTYYPAEEVILYYPDGTGSAGSPATLEINAIFYDGTDVLPVINLNDGLFDEFIDEIMNYEIDSE